MSVLIDYSSGAFEANQAQGVGAVTANDPNFADVSLLLHMDGTSGGTTFTDSSSNNVVVTANGDAQISTAQSKFGGASGYFDGTGDYLTTPYVTADYDWWTSDFTLEAWVYPTTFTGWYRFYSSLGDIGTLIGNMDSTGGSTDWTFGITSSGAIRLYYYSGGAVNTPASTETVSLNQWNHIAVVKDINGYKYFVNGVGGSYNSISGTPQSNASLGLAIGQFNSVGINGYVDDLRITKGTARYTSNFTPPTAAFLNSGPTLDLSSGTYFNYAPSANTTFAFANPPASGTAAGFALAVTPSATVTLTYPSSVEWPSGTAPDAPASGETDVLVFLTDDGGTSYQGFRAGDAMSSNLLADVLVVAGGGGGAGRDIGGGGGAGGYKYNTAVTMQTGQTYTVTVGSGGVGGIDSPGSIPGLKGGNSTLSGSGITTISTTGGGGGRSYETISGEENGGSGGGGSGITYFTAGTGISGEGFAGGNGLSSSNSNYGGGGGGGASETGFPAASGGNGGDGLASTITGTSVYYAGGGGGAGHRTTGTGYLGSGGAGGGGSASTSASNTDRSGTPNTGGGGGASRNTGLQGGNGGSGVVILRTTSTATATTGSPTVTTDGSYNIYKFTGSGSITF